MIHYHGIDGAKAEFLALVFANRHIFTSFAYPTNLEYTADICSTFALDNGAYTKWRQGKKYDFDGYREFVQEWDIHPAYDFHLIPDIIDGTAKQNLKLIESWNLDGVPVYHMHEPIDYLKDLCRGFKKVALGSSEKFSQVNSNIWWARMNTIMESICENGIPPCKLHGLRMLRINVFSRLPLSSADSTTVIRDSKYDKSWTGYNSPKAVHVRGLVIANRLENNQSSRIFKPKPITTS